MNLQHVCRRARKVMRTWSMQQAVAADWLELMAGEAWEKGKRLGREPGLRGKQRGR